MTAEITIMNKQAVAMAADSAVSYKGGDKIFQSANKIFSLSKYHPVGIMVYGNAEMMGIPWETTIKMYRKRLLKKKFDTLKEYGADFIEFLKSSTSPYDESIQESYFNNVVYGIFREMRGFIEENVKITIEKDKQISEDQIIDIVSERIDHFYAFCESLNYLGIIEKGSSEILENKYSQKLDDIGKDVFKKLPIPESYWMKLKRIGVSSITKLDIDNNRQSGIVIAGFGDKDVFPSVESYNFDGIAGNIMRCRINQSAKITIDSQSHIWPFAQGDVVETFMEGVAPNYRSHYESNLRKFFDDYPVILLDAIDKLSEAERIDLKEKFKKMSIDLLNAFLSDLTTFRRSEFIDPVVNIVSALPKDELAVMAETLVNLTAFKRKLSKEKESVGGSADVALITKGDGFIWIKRKHYFRPELNTPFFTNYFQEY